jgi:hypothetical protein
VVEAGSNSVRLLAVAAIFFYLFIFCFLSKTLPVCFAASAKPKMIPSGVMLNRMLGHLLTCLRGHWLSQVSIIPCGVNSPHNRFNFWH